MAPKGDDFKRDGMSMTAANFSELERLCALDSEATCDCSHCENFYKGMAQCLDALEDQGEFGFADIVMEALVNCVPNASGSRKTSDKVQSVMRKLRTLASRTVKAA
jgi:hypothetical protein